MIEQNIHNAIVITPPLVQLNAPYPSGAYLTSFFKKEGMKSKWYDLSIELFYSIFSKSGLTTLFDLTEEKAIKIAKEAEYNGDEATSYNLYRYISFRDNWIEWIDYITGMLCSGRKTLNGKDIDNGFSGREKEHQFLYSPFSPRGAHMDNFLSSLDHEVTIDDIRFLCSFALADLADYITAVFDNEFSLIRYAESLAVDERSFSEIEKKIDSPVLNTFYLPVLEKEFGSLKEKIKENKKTLVCISIPFAGTFLPALYTARYFKNTFGENVVVGIGGGFVNTELRDAKEKALKKYIDFISYDRGYGSFYAFLKEKDTKKEIYKTRIFNSDGSVTEPLWHDKEAERFENITTIKNVPDYTDIDFTKYPRLCDDKNAMHRIWSDGAWIKAYLAHGCYWAKCAFCDTTLDYVCGYKITDVENLYNSLLKTAREKGVYGIHFVDEALPPTALIKFGLLNARAGNPLYYWGNVRFEKSFTKDLAAFLSYCGLGAVSAGLEVATGEGLELINKGTDIKSIVGACAAFKEAGILVHAYMIYGFWNDTAQSIIDSMETLRQFFKSGLLDSSFWHKFVLTKNSTVYAKWEKEGTLDLVSGSEGSSCFAKNNLHFKGEEKYNKFGPALDLSLSEWMHGEKLDMKVQKWFDFPVPSPTINKNFIDGFIDRYEERCEKIDFDINKENLYTGPFYLGGNPIILKNKMKWIYLQEENEVSIKGKDKDEIKTLLKNLRPESSEDERKSAIKVLRENKEIRLFLESLHNIGIVYI